MKNIDLHLNSTCNQNCVFCVSGKTDKFNLNTVEAIKRISYVLKTHPDRIRFSGGEPTLRNDLPKLFSYIKNNSTNIEIVLLTNAMRLSYDEFLKTLNDVDLFSISIHGHTSKIHDTLTKTPGSFDKTIKGILNVQKQGKNFVFYHVITTLNVNHLIDFVNFVHKMFPKIRSIIFSNPFVEGNVYKNLDIIPKYSFFLPLLKNAKLLCESYNIKFYISNCAVIPHCIRKDYNFTYTQSDFMILKNSEEFYIKQFNPEKEKKKFIKSNSCTDCNFNSRCPGILKEYAVVHGTSELKSVKNN